MTPASEWNALELRAENKRLREALESLQWNLWNDTRELWMCPTCARHKSEGHNPVCRIALALREPEPSP